MAVGIAVATPYLGLAYAHTGRLTEAVPVLEEAVEYCQRVLGYLPTRLAAHAEGLLTAGRVAEADASARRALAVARERGARAPEAWSLCLLGDVAARGNPTDRAEGEGCYRGALALATELGMRPLVAHCHLGLAKLYRRTGKRQEAQEHLTTVTTMYRAMDMTYWLEQAEAEMRRLA